MLPIRILLVEDSFEHQRVFSDVLTENRPNVHVDVAYTGEEFVESAKDASIDCFLVDFNLPDGSAGQMLERASASIGDRPVIVMSSSNDQQIAVESFRHGGWDFVPKDQAVEGNTLWERIEAAIERWRRKCDDERKAQETIKQLLRQGETDSLTGLYNRHYFMGLMSKGSALRGQKQSLGCIMLDLDNFKHLNDTHGHAAGDKILKAVARVIKPVNGSPDIVLRWGGEEFVIFHMAETLGDCVLWAEMLRRRIAALRINHKNRIITCTASMGVVHRSARRLGLEIIDLADEALYLAKKQGRNCVCTWDMVCVERRLGECDLLRDDSPVVRRERFLQSCARTLGPQQLEHLTDHCEHVSRIAADLATMLHLSEDEIEHVRAAGLFHDIGKSVVPESLIAKREPLNANEVQLIHRHIDESERIAQRLGLDPAALKLVGLHHERYDSERKDEVPLGARILCAADAMAAMLSNRSYRQACTTEKMIDEMRRNKGSQFDPLVVDAATNNADHWRNAA